MKDCFWSLYNTIDDVRVDGLRTLQLRSLMRTIARGSLDEWLVWEEDTPDWKRASEILALLQADETLPAMSEPEGDAAGAIPANSLLLRETEDSGQKDDEPVDQRRNPRFLIALKIFINVDGRVITNTTVNVSVGGMKLRYPLPADITGSFDVTMVKGNVELSMKCRGLKNPNEKEVTRLLIEHCNRLDLLRTWLTRETGAAAG